jgi:ATP adenylyltransferase
VADLGPTHVALLNKFNVFEHHVLIVTRAFEDQLQPLGRDDLRALARVLVEIDGLGFYNAGEVAGASQRHKHLQLVALPLDPETPRPPVEARLLGDLGVGEGTEVASLPFAHAAVRLSDAAASDPERLARELGAAYATGLAVLDLDPGAPGPYNLLATRRWLLLVPRTRERWRGISINALGFAGSLLVREAAALARLRAAGPLAALCAVAPPRSGGSRPAPRA